jgi:hypothetical protein
VTCRKQWRQIAIQVPPSQQPHHPVPADLVGWCFNCLRQDHVAAEYPNATRCLRCHREGHCIRVCKRPRSLDATAPITGQTSPRGGGATPPAQRRSVGPSALTTTAEGIWWCCELSISVPCYLGVCWGWAPHNHIARSLSSSTPDGSPSCHTLPIATTTSFSIGVAP